MKVKLQVLICTHGEGSLDRVAAQELPRVAGVAYLVACQSTERSLPQSLVREDVDVRFTSSKGLSRNRNFVLQQASAPYLLIADDDLIFNPEGLLAVIAAFDEDPGLDFATFVCIRTGSRIYPPNGHDLAVPFKNYNPVSVELALRRSSQRKADLWFSPLMGVGAPYLRAGEENMFIHNAIAAGLKGRFFNAEICTHPGATTSQRQAKDPGFLRASGAYIILHYGLLGGFPRLVLKALRAPGSRLMRLRHLWPLLQGSAYALRHRRSLLRPQP